MQIEEFLPPEEKTRVLQIKRFLDETIPQVQILADNQFPVQKHLDRFMEQLQWANNTIALFKLTP